ncbi:MAG: hypothetical protein KJ971_01885 [Firmicutes bacterium]|nr:hypothetical protein [Bacillota bacterium]
MKKIYVIFMIFLVSFLSCCDYRSMNPNIELANSYELLFDLPENVEIISEEFVFEMDKSDYNDFCYSPPMEIMATYELINSGEEAEISFGLAFITNVRNYDSKIQDIKIMLFDDEIILENNQNHIIVNDYQFSDVNYSYFYSLTSIDDISFPQNIYKYHLSSEIVEDVSFTLSDTSKIIIKGDYTNISGVINMLSATESTIIYSFGTEVAFTTNNIIQSEIDLDTLIEEIETNEIVQSYVKREIKDFLESDQKITNPTILSNSVIEDETDILFFNTKTISIQENSTATIRLTYPLWASYNQIENRNKYNLTYNFYFDSERYANSTIDIQIYLISEYDFGVEYLDDETNLLMEGINENYHLQLNTIFIE